MSQSNNVTPILTGTDAAINRLLTKLAYELQDKLHTNHKMVAHFTNRQNRQHNIKLVVTAQRQCASAEEKKQLQTSIRELMDQLRNSTNLMKLFD